MGSEGAPNPLGRPGWYAQLLGDAGDLDDWRRTLNDPFDPVAEELPDEAIGLRSSEFEGIESADEVRSQALILISRLNGAMRLMHGTQPVRLGGIIKIDEQGRRHITVFAEAIGIALGRVRVFAAAVVLGPNGEPLPAAPPQPSDPQRWNELADKNDAVAELLAHFGRADNWYDIYKAVEVAEELAGGEASLRRLMGDSGKAFKNMRTSANHHRHARAHRPQRLVSIAEAKSLLSQAVRVALQKAGLP
jgi:hypothetical protein